MPVWHSSPVRFARLLSIAFLFFPALLLAQAVSQTTAAQVAEGRKIFAQSCAGCHGEDTYGTDRAPGLSGNRRVRARSVDQLRNLVLHGVPAAGMPAFPLPPPQLESVVAFVHVLNSAAYETPLSGSVDAGRDMFFGPVQQCSTCHMVDGRGSSIGPDLSSVGREMTVQEIEGVLRRPDAHITPGYELVKVHVRDGSTIEGFARGRTSFDIQLQDTKGQFHLLQSRGFTSVEKVDGSLMKPWTSTSEQSEDMLAYLGHLTAVIPGDRKSTSASQPLA